MRFLLLSFIFSFSYLTFFHLAQSQSKVEIGEAKTTFRLSDKSIGDDFDLSQTIAVPVYQIEQYYVNEQRTCTKVECQDVPVDGNPTWSGFFTTNNNEQKVKILSDLIRGIGKSTAEKIVAYGLINYRPNTWGKFVKHIYYVESELKKRGHAHDFAQEVVELYGYDNAKNLGYFQETQCKQVSYSCTVRVLKERQSFAYNISKKLNISYSGKGSNAVLYPFESEEIEIKTQGSGASTFEVKTGFNKYVAQISLRELGSVVNLEIQAISRNLVNLPSDMFVISSQFNSQGAELKVNTLNKYMSVYNPDNNFEVHYQVCAKKALSWSKSECKSPLAAGSQRLDQLQQTISIPFSYSSGAKYYVAYSIKLVNSSDFKTGNINQGASNTYKAP